MSDVIPIDSGILLGKKLDIKYNKSDLKSEPMLFRATREFARFVGGPLTKAFLNALDWEDCLIDSRVHMLMPGMYPCIPGWHHDDVP